MEDGSLTVVKIGCCGGGREREKQQPRGKEEGWGGRFSKEVRKVCAVFFRSVARDFYFVRTPGVGSCEWG